MKNTPRKKRGRAKRRERAEGAGPPGGKAAKEPKPPGVKAREFVEAIVTAIIFVLVIRQYAAETFHIPTQSMKPTLLCALERRDGREVQVRQGDHLIADKLYYKYHPVERFDIVLFKDPVPDPGLLDAGYSVHRTLIKRIVGLPGDTIEIRHGDLYVTNDELKEEIPEKPRAVQDALWRNVFTTEFRDSEFIGKWRMSGQQSVTSRQRENGIEFDLRAPGRADYLYPGPVDDTLPLSNPVGDVLLEVAVHPLEGGGAVELMIVEDGDTYTLHMPVGGGSAYLQVGLGPDHRIREGLEDRFESRKEKDVSLPVGRTSVISLTNADDRIVAGMNGAEMFRIYAPVEPAYRDDTDFEAKKRESSENRAGLALDGCHVVLEKLRLARDVYYTDVLYVGTVKDKHGRPVIPAKCSLIILKDKDGSLIRAVEKDGRLVCEDGRPLPPNVKPVAGIPSEPKMDNGTKSPYSIGKGEYFAMGDNSPGSLDSRAWGVVPKEFILGRAVFLFWPFPPFSDTFRPKLAR